MPQCTIAYPQICNVCRQVWYNNNNNILWSTGIKKKKRLYIIRYYNTIYITYMYIGTRTSVADDAFLSKYTISIRINYWNNYYYKTQHGTYIYTIHTRKRGYTSYYACVR